MGKLFTNSEFIDICKKVHNSKYNYDLLQYKSAHDKVIIVCQKHGKFLQIANDHKRGRGCPQCGLEKISILKMGNTLNFIKRSIKIHKEKYDYSLVDYKNKDTKVKIICKKHGEFLQNPQIHIRGSGCPKCGHKNCNKTRIKNNNVSAEAWRYKSWERRGNLSKNFNSFSCYIIKCWNNDESFYKIGKTFRKIEDRFSNKIEMPYNWFLIKKWEGTSINISILEKELQNLNKKFKHKPKLKFGGSYECFNKLKLNE